MAFTLQLTKEDVIDIASALTNQRVLGRRVNQFRRNALTKLLEATSGLELGSVVLNALKPKRAAPPATPAAADTAEAATAAEAAAATAAAAVGSGPVVASSGSDDPGEAALEVANAAAAAKDARLAAVAAAGRSARGRVGLLGCGDIAFSYAASLRRSGVAVSALFDLDAGRAEALANAIAAAPLSATAHPLPGVSLLPLQPRPRVATSLEDFFDDPNVVVVVNLTPPAHHFATTQQALRCGKHVWSEKPLATSPHDARTLVSLAAQQQLELGCSPMTWLGEAAQTLAANLPRLGAVRLASADVHCGSWAPLAWRLGGWRRCARQGVGSVVDVGVYPLSLLTALLGPVRDVTAHRALPPPRTADGGAASAGQGPQDGPAEPAAAAEALDVVSAHLRFCSGATATLSASLSLSSPRPRPLLLWGDGGCLALGKGAGLVVETTAPPLPAAAPQSVAAGAPSPGEKGSKSSGGKAEKASGGADLWDFDAPVSFCDSTGRVRKVLPPVGVPTKRHAPHPHACDWARGVVLLADAVDARDAMLTSSLHEVQPSTASEAALGMVALDAATPGVGQGVGVAGGRRFTGAHALHLVEVMDAIQRAACAGTAVRLPRVTSAPGGGDGGEEGGNSVPAAAASFVACEWPQFAGPLPRWPPGGSGSVLCGAFPGLAASDLATRPPASRLVLGTMRLAECADASSLLDAAFALGVNVFDVAPVYGAGGAAETAVGKWLEAKLAEASQQRADNAFTRRGGVDGDATCRDGFFCRGDVYLVGKACHPAQGRPRLTPKALAEDVAASLRRLKGAQHLDLLLLHRDDPNVPAKEACVVAMVQQEALVPGFALAWGTSNWQPSRIAALMEACQHLGVPPPCADAPQASLAAPVRAVWPGTTCCTREHAALHAREKLALFGWAPLAAGYLTDRGVSDGGGGGGGDGPFATAANAARRHRAAAWGASRGLSLAQVGVAFGVQRFADAFPAFVVLGTSDAAHLAELAAATQVRLTRADVRHLYDGSPLAE